MREFPVARFDDVTLLVPDDPTAGSLKGSMYMTNLRFLFLPKNTIPHPKLVHCHFRAMRILSGRRSSFGISVVDEARSSVDFQFPSEQSLFQVFNLLRLLGESIRRVPSGKFKFRGLDETPFSSLEVEFPEIELEERSYERAESRKMEQDPLSDVLRPMKDFFDYCNSLSFDIDLKLRFLFVLSLVSFFLQFIPFFFLLHLSLCAFLLRNVWKSVNKSEMSLEGNTEIPVTAGGFVKAQRFVSDWLFWRNPHKTVQILIITLINLVVWMMASIKTCIFVSILVFWWFFLRKGGIYESLRNLICGFWLCT
jgi:hypothetical protein